jgi:hypothetical protein
VGKKAMSREPSTEQPIVFNSPVESGLRSLVLLTEAFPLFYDLQRIIFFDYLIVHSGDAPGGPPSIHPGTPDRTGEVLVRRGLIERGLDFLASRGLIEKRFDANGITYGATEYASPVIDCLRTPYSALLKERSAWVVQAFGNASDDELKTFFRSNLDRWGSEFEHEPLFREIPK